MKSEDFEQLKKLCQENYFELLNVDHEDNEKFYVIAKKKDPWDGVDYFKTPKVIFKIDRIENGIIEYQEKGDILHISTRFVHPSTESAYIEQLKKEAFERFGEIKEGDGFDRTGLGRDDIPLIGVIGEWTSPKGFAYYKDEDYLSFNGSLIYRQGKWATRVKERVEVKNKGFNQIDFIKKDLNYVGVTASMKMDIIGDFKSFSNDKAGDFLASQLEAYLNIKDFECSQNGEIISFHIKPKKGADLDKVESKVRELAQMISE